MTLYMLLSNHYPLKQLEAIFQEQDELLVLGDGVYQLPLLGSFKQILVRESDLAQRGLSTTQFTNTVCINDEQWVEKTLHHKPIVSLK